MDLVSVVDFLLLAGGSLPVYGLPDLLGPDEDFLGFSNLPPLPMEQREPLELLEALDRGEVLDRDLRTVSQPSESPE